MLHLYLVRHGETDWNAGHRYQGHSDLPLNRKGIEQARQLAGRLKSQKVELVFSSDLRRAMETAQILMEGRDTPIQPEPRLREIKFGVLEGHTFDEALKLWPEMIKKWVEDNNQPPDGGERLDEFVQRVSRFMEEIRQSCADKTVLIVAHAGPLREIIRSLLVPAGAPDDFLGKLRFSLENASLTEFQIDDENIIINRLNDVGHLDSAYT
jgi:alpha-ribazole phosphatase